MERLTTKLPNGYLFNLPPLSNEKAQEEFVNKLSEKLGRYEDAEEQGLLLRLPCKVGDEIYWLDHQNFINKSIVNCIYVECGLGGIRIETLTCDLCLNELGKTVFLTKEEAEKALEDMKGKV